MKAYIFPNLDKKNSLDITVETCEILHRNGINVSIDNDYSGKFDLSFTAEYGEESELIAGCDMVLAIGGDGTIIRCAGLCTAFDKPILGINCGRLGFMAALEHTELEKLSLLKEGRYTKSKRMMLTALVYKNGKLKGTFNALNDIVLSKCSGSKIADFEVSKEKRLISSLRADGIIFSTPTGATAYSMSAGGPIIEPELECIEFTQICPHSLFARSMVFSPDSLLNIRCHANSDAKADLTIDGNHVFDIGVNDRVTVKKSENSVELIDIIGGSFFNSINMKLMQPLKGSNETII